jgi:hypothetical protein
LQAGQGDAPGFDAHPTAQYDRIEPMSHEFLGESLDVRCPLGEHEAMPAAFQRAHHVADHLSSAGIVRDEVPVDGAAGFRAAASELPSLDLQQLADSRPPLVGEGLAVDEHERRRCVMCDQRARDHRLARSRRSDQHAQVVTAQAVHSVLLLPGQGGRERELL